MRFSTLALVAPLVLGAAALPAHAGPYTDQFSMCLVAQTSQEDKINLVRWISIAYTAHPGVADLVTVDPAQVELVNQTMAQIFTALLTERCVTQGREAVQYEGQGALEAAFNTLGQVAAGEMLQDPKVNEMISGFVAYTDMDAVAGALGLN